MRTSVLKKGILPFAVLLLVLGLIAAACGDDAEETTTTGAQTTTTGAQTTTTGGGAEACAPEDVWLLQSGRDLANPYYVIVDAGAKCFAEAVGLGGQYQFVASEHDAARQLSQITSYLAAHGPCVAVNVDPHETSILPQILDAVEEAGAYVVSQWSRPDDIMPGGDYPHWVAHMTFDGVDNGYQIAKALFDHMGGSGNIVALQGVLDNQAAITRFQGLEKALAEYPDIVLLDDQTANWNAADAQAIVEGWLAEYGDEIGGVWAANDNMAIGAIEALRAAGKNGAIQVTGVDAIPDALAALQAGDLIATVNPDPAFQGAIGLAMGYYAAIGQLDPATIPDGQRSAFHQGLLVTADNVADFLGEVNCANYADLWRLENLFSRVTGPDH
jgi:ribose transport system substrate-binding protein